VKGICCYSSRQGPLVIEPFDPSTEFILSPSTSLRVNCVEGLRAPLRSGNYEINALTTLAVAIIGEERAEKERLRAERESLRAQQESLRAQQESLRAEEEKQRADRLAQKLREMGINPDEV